MHSDNIVNSIKAAASDINNKELQIADIASTISTEFQRKSAELQETSNTITKSIENIDRDINKLFEQKSKLQTEVKEQKEKLLNYILGL